MGTDFLLQAVDGSGMRGATHKAAHTARHAPSEPALQADPCIKSTP